MGCCFSGPIDYEGEVTLYHFDLHRAVGRGAFGKVRYLLPGCPGRGFNRLLGPRCRAQTDEEALCSQVRRQSALYAPKGRSKHYTGAQAPRGGACLPALDRNCYRLTPPLD